MTKNIKSRSAHLVFYLIALALAGTTHLALAQKCATSSPGGQGLTTIYSNLGAVDNVYDCCSALTSSGPKSNLHEAVEVANAFTPTANATITQVQIAVGHALGPKAITISIWSDNNGVPGTVIEQWDWRTFSTLGGGCVLMTKNFTAGVPVSGGVQYWLVVGQPNASVATWNGWNLNTTSSTGPIAIKIGKSNFENQGTQQQGAFGIFGQ
jgi:hypothetical protein